MPPGKRTYVGIPPEIVNSHKTIVESSTTPVHILSRTLLSSSSSSPSSFPLSRRHLSFLVFFFFFFFCFFFFFFFFFILFLLPFLSFLGLYLGSCFWLTASSISFLTSLSIVQL